MKLQLTIVTTLIAAFGLCACGGGSGGGASAAPPAGTGPQPAVVDSFTQNVQAVAATATDVGAPLMLDSYVAVAADQAAPVAVY